MLKCSVSMISIVVLFITFNSFITYAQGTLKSPVDEFTKHQVVRPVFYHSREKPLITTTKKDNGFHETELTVTIPTEDVDYILDLKLNKELLNEGHKIIIKENGQHKVHLPNEKDIELCQYRGIVRGYRNSWAAVSTCDGLRGSFYDGLHMHYIENAGDYKLDSNHYLYNHKHRNSTHKCGYDHDENYFKELPHLNKTQSRLKRSSESSAGGIFGPFNSNELTRYVEFVIVVDYLEYVSNNEDIQSIHSQCKDVANIVNALYAPLNIFITLVGVVIWKEPEDNRQVTEDANRTLDYFLAYRMNVLQDLIKNDNAQLLTGQKFLNGVVGKAMKGTMCTFGSSGGIVTNHSKTLDIVAVTIAHEMGHNFGMDHDDDQDCTCPDSKCIMYAASSSYNPPTHWSSCSLKSFAFSFQRGLDYCLRNKPKSLFASPTCGNGFVEPSEQCDCGPSWLESKCSQCCHPETCMLRENATCAIGGCCNIDTCSPHTPGTMCRRALTECDLPEYCTGHSEHCPDDLYKMDTTPCHNRAAFCANGKCRTHSDQCKLLWGTTGKRSQRECFDFNVKGDKAGNCGYDPTTRQFKKCFKGDTMCGLLHCQHLNERLEFGVESASVQQETFININSTIVPCRTVLIELGLGEVDPGLSPDGAVCGTDKMCYRQKCVKVEEIRNSYATLEYSECPSNCSGRGVCNSLGECHCNNGFGPPLCQSPGHGGSRSSGPATDPTIHYKYMVTMYIIFLGIIPSIALCIFLYYYSRQNVLCWWIRPRKTMQSPNKVSLPRRISRGASKFASNFTSSNGQNPNMTQITSNTPSDEMSSSLLRGESDPSSPPATINPNVEFFGNFKGFSLTPIAKNTNVDAENGISIIGEYSNGQGSSAKPVRVAPPVPAAPKSPKARVTELKRSNSGVHAKIKMFMTNEKPEEVKVPPPRPTISGPILEDSTCTAKEVISPLQTKTVTPHRSAPLAPTEVNKRPVSANYDAPAKPLPEEPTFKKPMNKITSFLKNEKTRNALERSHSLPKNPKLKPTVVDRSALRNLQISNPILQKDIDLPVGTVPVHSDSDDTDSCSSIMRTQSMRVAPLAKPEILSFGSMRAARPTVPPPPRPNASKNIYQNADAKNLYDDCGVEPKSSLANINEENPDNIYAVIEEGPIPPQKTIPCSVPDGYNVPRPVEALSGSSESVGLLGEIVSEIQNRNFESIYSTSTLARKKKEAKRRNDSGSSYDKNGSNSSTTSSGYLAPSVVNVPQNSGASGNNASDQPSPSQKGVNSKIPKFGRQVTPPSLKSVPSSPKNIPKVGKQLSASMSPDLVSSCSPNTYATTVKSPDVINSNANKCDSETSKTVQKSSSNRLTVDTGKPPLRPFVEKKTNPPKVVTPKPNVVPKPSLESKPSIRNSVKVDPNVKNVLDSLNKNKPKIVPKPVTVTKTETNQVKASTTKATGKPSNVASIQQKFENRKSIPGDSSTVKKY